MRKGLCILFLIICGLSIFSQNGEVHAESAEETCAAGIPPEIITMCKSDEKIYQLICVLDSKMKQKAVEEIHISKLNVYTAKADEINGTSKLLEQICYEPANENYKLIYEIRMTDEISKNKKICIYLINKKTSISETKLCFVYDKTKMEYVKLD